GLTLAAGNRGILCMAHHGAAPPPASRPPVAGGRSGEPEVKESLMQRRVFPWLAVLCLAAAPAAARAAESPAEPTLVVRVQSIDGLLDTFKYLANAAGQEEAARQIEGLIQARTGAKGLEGIDTKKPFGAYGVVSPDLQDSSAVVL